MSRKAGSAQGDAGGDQSGGGKQGGGQGGKQPGNDKPGGTSPGDQGAGAAQGPARATWPSAGRQTRIAGTDRRVRLRPGRRHQIQTGRRGNGRCGGTRRIGARRTLAVGSENADRRAPSESGQGLPLGGGTPSSAELQGGNVGGEVPPGEQPNLEYARKATDLVSWNT